MVGPTRTHDAFGRKREKPLTDDELEVLTGSRTDRVMSKATDGTLSAYERLQAKRQAAREKKP